MNTKTKFIAYIAASIDGRISVAPNVLPDWTSKEDWKFFQKGLSKADAVVVGRNTYEVVPERLQKRTTFVLSSKPKTITRHGSVTFVNPKKVDLKELFKEYKTVAVVGGGQVYQAMLDLGLLDEIYLTIEPVIFGRGPQMFVGGTKNISLKLQSIKKLNARGALLLRYINKK